MDNRPGAAAPPRLGKAGGIPCTLFVRRFTQWELHIPPESLVFPNVGARGRHRAHRGMLRLLCGRQGRCRRRKGDTAGRSVATPDYLEGSRCAPREVSGKRSPYDGDIDVATNDRIHDPSWWIGFQIVAVYGVARYVLDNVSVADSVGRRRIVEVVADDLYANLHASELRIVEAVDVNAAISPIDEYIAGPVVGSR